MPVLMRFRTALRNFGLRLLLLSALGAFAFGRASAESALHSGDTFELRLGGIPLEYTQEVAMAYTVAEDGTVKVPYVGVVSARGATPTQLSRKLERLFVTAKVFTNPTVSLTLPALSRFVTVGGEVKAPQAVTWTPDLTLTAAVIRAGDVNEFTKGAHTAVIREGKSSRYDLRALTRHPEGNPKLQPGDEVRVE